MPASINPSTEAGLYSAIDLGNQDATFVLGRYWNLNITSGSLNGNVNIRFFYDSQESDTLEAAAIRWNQQNAGNTGNVSGLRWFAVNSGTFDPASPDLQALGVSNSSQLFPTNQGLQDGVDFVEFSTNILTGGGLGYTIGTNSVILPVELLMFEAIPTSDRQVNLTWVTASEVNNDLFEVQRSSDLANWETIEKVIAKGNSSEEQYYFTTDLFPLLGRSYCRLEQLDFDGTLDISEVRDIYLSSNESGDIKFTVYPNPSNNLIHLYVASDVDCTFEIRNAMGQIVREVQTRGSETTIISGLGSGVYFLTCLNSAINESFKIVITK